MKANLDFSFIVFDMRRSTSPHVKPSHPTLGHRANRPPGARIRKPSSGNSSRDFSTAPTVHDASFTESKTIDGFASWPMSFDVTVQMTGDTLDLQKVDGYKELTRKWQ